MLSENECQQHIIFHGTEMIHIMLIIGICFWRKAQLQKIGHDFGQPIIQANKNYFSQQMKLHSLSKKE